MPSVTVNNVRINYIEQGAGDEALIFVHGLTGSIRHWKDVLERLPKEYRAYVDQYGAEKAGPLIDLMYGQYKRLCFVAHTQADLDEYRPQAIEVAEFCAQRWGLTYQERIGSDGLIRRLLESPRHKGDLGDEFVVIPPGGTVEQMMFLRMYT